MEFSTKKRSIVTNSTNNVSANISMNNQKLEEVASFKYLCNPLQRWYALRGSPQQDCLSNGSDGQTKQDSAV